MGHQLKTGYLSADLKSKQEANLEPKSDMLWTKAPFANLVRYEPSGMYFARIRVHGKLIRKTLETSVLSVAKQRLDAFAKAHRQAAENKADAKQGKMLFSEVVKILRTRLNGDATLKPLSRCYYEQRLVALLKSWPTLEQKDVRTITKSDCLDWSAKFDRETCATAFNNTISILRRALDIVVELGIRYDNPATDLKRVSVKSKKLTLPEFTQFTQFLQTMESGGGRDSRNCADLVRFLAFGGFRLGEASNITWGDCNFAKSEITVRGEAETGTKNSEVRKVPMISDMVTLLNRLREVRPNDGDDILVMQVKECQKAIDRAAKMVGMTRITHQDLRHLFATRCIESGVDIPTVSRWLGHKDGGALAMKVYGHLRDQHSASMAKKVTFSSGKPELIKKDVGGASDFAI
jgi:integrase